MPENGDVLATRMYVSVAAGPPTSPSARPHSVPVAVGATALCASIQNGEGRGHHIARSTMIGTSLALVTMAERAALARALPSPGNCSSLTQMLKRLAAGTM